MDKSLSDSFNLCKDFSISSCTSKYEHSNHSLVWECTKTLDNILREVFFRHCKVPYPPDKVIHPNNWCQIITARADAVNLTVRATGSVSRYSLALKQLIKYTCTILHTEINFNQIESLVGKKLYFPLSFLSFCLCSVP